MKCKDAKDEVQMPQINLGAWNNLVKWQMQQLWHIPILPSKISIFGFLYNSSELYLEEITDNIISLFHFNHLIFA
jgi:hypothetical protein